MTIANLWLKADIPLNITAQAAAPSGAVTGDIYLDDGTNTASGNPAFRLYTGSTWEDLDGGGGSGDVTGAASSTDNALVRFDSTTGKVIQNSNATLSDAGALVVTQGAVINESGADSDTRIEGDTATHLFFADASLDAIGINASTVNAVALLQLDSTTKGFLPPRMTTAQREAISTPPDGMVVYDTDIDALHVVADGSWVALGAGTASAVMDVDGTAGETVAENDNVYLKESDNKWYLIDTNASPPACGEVRGVVVTGGSADASISIRRKGLKDSYTGLTAGLGVWASTTPGGYTQTKPALTDGGGQVAFVYMGVARSTTEVFVDPDPTVIYGNRETLADDATIQVIHHSDTASRIRRVRAFTNTTTYSADLCTGGTASASAAAGGAAASNAFDDNVSNAWWDSTNTGAGANGVAYIAYDLGMGNDADIRRVVMYNASPGGYTSSYAASSVKVQYSDNGSSWSDAQTFSSLDTTADGTNPGAVNTLTITSSAGAHRYWRILCNSSVTSGWALADVEMKSITGTAVGENCVIGRWSGTTGDLLARFDDGAGANNDTCTTFKNVMSASFDITVEVEI